MWTSAAILLLLGAFTAPVTHAMPRGVCESPHSPLAGADCKLDLTVIVDASVAMGSLAHVTSLLESVKNDFLPLFNQSVTNNAVIAFGIHGAETSQYFGTYDKICRQLLSIEAEVPTSGLGAANLTQAFVAYRNNLLSGRPDVTSVVALFTAVTNDTVISKARPVADELTKTGVQLFVFGLGQSSSRLSTLSPNTVFTKEFSVPDPLSAMSSMCKTAGGGSKVSSSPSTVIVPSTVPAESPTAVPTVIVNPSDPTMNITGEFGNLCAANIDKAWLDIVIAVDVSSTMSLKSLVAIKSSLKTIFRDFPIGQTLPHTTRVALVTFASTATIRFSLSQIKNAEHFQTEIEKLTTYRLPHDEGGNIQDALEMAASVIPLNQQDLPSNETRPPVIFLISEAYNDEQFTDPVDAARNIKKDRVVIATCVFDNPDSIFTAQKISALSSPGFAFTTNMSTTLVQKRLLDANCICPRATEQFVVADTNGTLHLYADCLRGVPTVASPDTGPCLPGILVPVMNLAKLTFIDEVIIQKRLKGGKFLINAIFNPNQTTGWYWTDYENVPHPLSYPVMPPQTSTSKMMYGYASKHNDDSYEFMSHDVSLSLPSVCQYRACDTDFDRCAEGIY